MTRITFETLAGSAAASAIGAPLAKASFIAAEHPSLLGVTDPKRAESFMGIPHFYDHAGNLVNGVLPAMVAVYAGTIISLCIDSDERKKSVIIASTLVGADAAAAANIAYEAGAKIPLWEAKPIDAPFDLPDAAYGSAAGILVTTTFCITSLALMRRRRSKESKQHESI